MPILFFVLGFVFDAVMLKRIDEPLAIAQQALYIIISATLIAIELIEEVREVHAHRMISKIWQYREGLLHFLMGTLLNAYTIFYFKSASAFTSFFFIVILVGLLMINEFKRFGKSQSQVHVVLISLCLISYLVSIAPIAYGFIGIIPFLTANAVMLALVYLYYSFLKKPLATEPRLLKFHILMPAFATQAIFASLYFLHAIPPVPLSVTYMGIYHSVKHMPGEGYQLQYTRPSTKFWQHGDQTFLARPGDEIYCFARIFSPARFRDRLQVRWLYKDERRGWQPADAIPLQISGGRDEGYRVVTKKTNYQPGEWRVQIETMDGREIGRINLEVESDSETGAREVTTVTD
jgi:hypothetical protein